MIGLLNQEFNEAESGYSSWMLDKAEDQGYIEGTSVGKLTYDRESGKWTGEDGKEYTAAWNEKKNSWDVKEVKAGYECGLTIERFNDIKEGDIIEGYEDQQVKDETNAS